ncbi:MULTISPECIES: DEAD/DEAH box helicase family protein [Clostridium]|uniref:DEAD/DEAH box helicase family protein n=1 Tax=Clostridium TaxID=1485 RepID=UPI0028FF3F48|nr:DEAD/DEAH box helicase family protein [Clostridium sp.]MDU1312165.1 DEAD/DEAH box helicase family protein [Clostridium sp.]MDU1409558.1 DEAD/DEAH box helicase family protein [Clostridium sp.]
MIIEEKQINTVTDLIGDSYKYFRQGEHIILDCATGSGKTYFVLNVLGNWCKLNNKRILYLCNRTELKKKVIEESKSFNTEEVIDIYTYQYIQNENNVYEVREYDYVVFDECHYIFNEGWNMYTDIISEVLIQRFMSAATMIFMSATGEEIFKNLINSKVVKKHNRFIIEADYSYVDKLVFYDEDTYLLDLIDKLSQGEKLIYICANKEKAYLLKQELGDDAYFMCSKYDKRYKSDNPIKVISSNPKCISFDRKVLITTSVLDVGIDIFDKAVTNIVTDLYDMTTLIQALGRKRLVDSNDRVIIHIKNRNKKNISGIMNGVINELRIANLYLQDKELFAAYVGEQGRTNLVNKCFYDAVDVNGEVVKVFNHMYYLHLKYKVEELYVAKEIGFDTLVRLKLGSTVKNVEYNSETKVREQKDKVSIYLESIKDLKLFKAEKEELINVIGLKDGRGRKQKALKMLNTYLEINNISFMIIAKKSGSKRYWKVESIDRIGTNYG